MVQITAVELSEWLKDAGRPDPLLLDVRDRTAQILDGIRLSDPITPVPSFAEDTA